MGCRSWTLRLPVALLGWAVLGSPWGSIFRFLRLHSPGRSLTLLFAECASTWQCSGSQEDVGTPPLVDTVPFVVFPFKCAESFWTRDTFTFYYGKCQRFTEVEQIVQWTPMFLSPRFTSDHFMDIFVLSVSPKPLLPDDFKANTGHFCLCSPETKPLEFCWWGEDIGTTLLSSNFHSGLLHCSILCP